jgi:D-amino-acid dehydrogenase
MGHQGSLLNHSPDVVVLGAGVVGVSTAYYLNQRGLDVLVVDRLPGPGLETSFANGGQVSVSHAEPWANPSAPLKVLKWLGRDDSPLLFRPRFDPAQWRWLLGWMAECRPARARRNTVRILELALHSRGCIQQIRASEGFSYDSRSRGILHFYRSEKEFDAAVPVAALMREYGCEREVVDRARILELEPAFGPNIAQVVGATYTAADESGDAQAFTAGLAEVCRARGVRFRWNTEVTALRPAGGALESVELKDLATGRYEQVAARAAVVALASWSPRLVRPLGIRLNIYPAKGYSVTIPTAGSTAAPEVSLTDDEYKLVYSRLGDRLRVAGTAELSGFDRDLNPLRVRAILDNVRALFPGAGDFDAATAWTGLRPTTPSNVPYLGRSAVAGVYLNTGHGTLGWTMGPGCGARVAEDIAADFSGGRLRRGRATTLLAA